MSDARKVKVGDHVSVMTHYWTCPRCGSGNLCATYYTKDYPSPHAGTSIASDHNTPRGGMCQGGWVLSEEDQRKRGQRVRTGVVVLMSWDRRWVEVRFDDQGDSTHCHKALVDGNPVWLGWVETRNLVLLDEKTEAL